MFALVIVAQAVSLDVAGGYARPLDDSMDLNDGWGGAVAARVTWPISERIAIGPRLVFDVTRIPQGNHPIVSSSLLAGVAVDTSLGAHWTLSVGLAGGATHRSDYFLDEPETKLLTQRFDTALIREIVPHVGAGLFVAYEEYASTGDSRINQFQIGATLAATTDPGTDAAFVPLRVEFGIGAGYYRLAGVCGRCDAPPGFALAIGVTGRVSPQLRVGIDGTLIGTTWYAGPVVVADVHPRVAVRGSIGAGTWDGNDHDGGILGVTGISASAGVDVRIRERDTISMAAFARGEVIRGNGVVPVVIAGLVFGVGR